VECVVVVVVVVVVVLSGEGLRLTCIAAHPHSVFNPRVKH
jgi:hypothetical protein